MIHRRGKIWRNMMLQDDITDGQMIIADGEPIYPKDIISSAIEKVTSFIAPVLATQPVLAKEYEPVYTDVLSYMPVPVKDIPVNVTQPELAKTIPEFPLFTNVIKQYNEKVTANNADVQAQAEQRAVSYVDPAVDPVAKEAQGSSKGIIENIAGVLGLNESKGDSKTQKDSSGLYIAIGVGIVGALVLILKR